MTISVSKPLVLRDQVDQATLDDKYTLPRNDSERARLDAQHVYLKEILDGRLIVDKDVAFGPESHILDSGTGAASWILDFLKTTSDNVKVTGVDISTTMFPKEIPSNVRLYQMSCLSLPKTWDDSFDLVNQRLLLAAFTEMQWLQALSELFRVLKPGGAIQLTEFGFWESAHGSPLPLLVRKIIEYPIALFKKRDIVGYEIGQRLPGMLEKVGFSDVRVEKHRAPVGRQWGDIGLRGSQNCALFFRTVGAMCVCEGDLGVCKSYTEVDDAVERAKQEWDNNNPEIFQHLYVVTARKPLYTAPRLRCNL